MVLFYGPADVFFLALHTVIIVFNLFGWIWWRTRRANLWLLLATGASWLGLGLFYGIGYCPITDWHYQVLVAHGVQDLPRSYIAYIIHRFTGTLPPAQPTDVVVALAYVAALVASIGVNLRDRLRQQR